MTLNQKKTLSAKAVVADVRAGLSDAELMEKYGLSPKELERVYRKLVEAGVLTQAEVQYGQSTGTTETENLTSSAADRKERRPPLEEPSEANTEYVDFVVEFVCPACLAPQPSEHEVCPQCGVIVAKFKQKLEKEEEVRKSEYGKRLLEEVRQLNTAGVEDLLDKGAYIDTQDQRGRTPLILAASYGSAEIVKLLLSRGADASVKAAEGQTAYFVAQSNGDREVADLLRSQATPEESEELQKTSDQPSAPVSLLEIADRVKEDGNIDKSPARPVNRASPKNNLNRRWVLIVIGLVILLGVLTIIQRSLINRDRAQEEARKERQADREREVEMQRMMSKLPSCSYLADLFNNAADLKAMAGLQAFKKTLSIESDYECLAWSSIPGRKLLFNCYKCANTATG
ncbi:MAG: ankyrin repeat domain-containing protein [Pseudomonadota bacterium]